MKKRKTDASVKPELLTIEEVASLTNLGRYAVRRAAVETGTLIKIGKLVRIDYNRFMAALRQEYTA